MYRPLTAEQKRNLLVNDIATAVGEVLRKPEYSALSIGGETKEAVLEQITMQLDDKIKQSKEKSVDRILEHVKRSLMNAPQFEFNHEKQTGTIVFTYAQPQEDKDWGF